MIQKKPPVFNDGIVRIYRVRNQAEAGGMPRPRPCCLETLRFARRTVGVARYWAAKQEQVQADLLIRCPRRESVSTQDVAVLTDGRQYEIKQIQTPEGICPPVMDLTLERVAEEYGFEPNP